MINNAEQHQDDICVAALYRFVALPNYADLRHPMLKRMQELKISGTLLLAPEGINGTIAAPETAIDALIQWLANTPHTGDRLANLEVKKSWAKAMPFLRAKVKLKNEIVTMGVPGIDPQRSAGTYVDPKDWNELISDPDVLTIDTRNNYEIQIGQFENAVNPNTKNFREFPAYARSQLTTPAPSKVAMYCTGGIRCEKASSYLRELGFEEVYHLKGGILKYLEEIPPEDSLWRGECFVFDERVAVDHNLEQGSYTQCHACRMPLSAADRQSKYYAPGVACPHCHNATTPEQRARFQERHNQMSLARERGEAHLGDAAADVADDRRAAK